MSIKKLEYKDFSWDLHEKAGHKPIVAQMELTYRCPLHCKHCYADCYNRRETIKYELSTEEIKNILNKCKKDGVLWFCFTGGDPLIRKDFAEIYSYARELGFIVTVFTSLIPLNQKILETFRKNPPFGIETTLNAATFLKYKEITNTNYFRKQIEAIKKLLKNNLPVKVKTQITRQNVGQIDKIKKTVESFGLNFRPSTMIFARINHDTFPCSLRLKPEDVVKIDKNYGYFEEEELRKPQEKYELKKLIGTPKTDKLLSCAAGGNAFWISPQGIMSICSCLKKPEYDLVKDGNTVKEGFYKLSKEVHSMRFTTNSRCRSCRYRLICRWCPGRAYLEKGSFEEPIDYFCQLTEQTIKEYAD